MSETGPTPDVSRASASEAGRASAPQEPLARLARAETAYAAGDFAAVHGLCVSLAGAQPDAELSARAKALSARVAIDPANWIAIGCGLLLFAIIVVAYVG